MGKQHAPGFLKLVQEAKQVVKECNVQDVKGRLDRGESFHLVDVREDREWEASHLPGAIHLGKGIIERDVEKTIPDSGRPDCPLLRRRLPLGPGGQEPAGHGLHQRDLDGWRL